MKIRLFTIPNIITLSSLTCGMLAVVAALNYPNGLMIAFWLVVAAAVFDFLDGFAARLLKQSSEIGVQLDSLSDMVSFGVAPAVILLKIYEYAPISALDLGLPSWLGYGVFIVTLFSALRLAKFNIDTTQKTEFEGLPTPACALFFAACGWITEYCVGVSSESIPINRVTILIVAVVFACLLICKIRMFSLKFHGFGWSDNKLIYIFLICSAVALAVWHIFAIPAIILAYILISIVRHIILYSSKKQ